MGRNRARHGKPLIRHDGAYRRTSVCPVVGKGREGQRSKESCERRACDAQLMASGQQRCANASGGIIQGAERLNGVVNSNGTGVFKDAVVPSIPNVIRTLPPTPKRVDDPCSIGTAGPGHDFYESPGRCEGPDHFGSTAHETAEAEAEREHFAHVCFAFRNYAIDALRDIARIEGHFYALSKDDQALLIEEPAKRVKKMKQRIATNQAFLNLLLVEAETFQSGETEDKNSLPSVDGGEHVMYGDTSNGAPEASNHVQRGREAVNRRVQSSVYRNCTDVIRARNVSKTRSTLRQFVRDWSDEGKDERDAAYAPLLQALEETLPLERFIRVNQRAPNDTGWYHSVMRRILCPGSGLGRLPFEVVRRGYGCQGNEFSYFMILGSNLILNTHLPPKSCSIYPYVLSTSNRAAHEDNNVEIRIPDICPVDVVQAGQEFSMCAGEFVEVYWNQVEEWDGVLTCFFIDTAQNVLLYIRTIARLLPPGGLWANLGPLLYHFSEMEDEMSIELSWEEIKSVVQRYFTITKEDWREAYYTRNPRSMMQVKYQCIHFVAIRNDVKVVGTSIPVY